MKMKHFAPMGYLAKRVETDFEYLKQADVEKIYSQSNCLSKSILDIESDGKWKFNGFVLYNSPQDIIDICREKSISLEDVTFFYYEVYSLTYDEIFKKWNETTPDITDKMPSDVVKPSHCQLEGFDVVCDNHFGPGCSPLSCNHLALEPGIKVNKYCLLESPEQAVELMEKVAFDNSEPGPFRIVAVYSIPSPVVK